MRTQEQIMRYYHEWIRLELNKVLSLYDYIQLREGK